MTASGQIATALGLTESELSRQALIALLQQRKRESLQLRLEILSRCDVRPAEDLKARISDGRVTEHPAWEGVIVVENLMARIGELDGYLDDLLRMSTIVL